MFFLCFCLQNSHKINSNSNSVMILHFSFWLFSLLFPFLCCCCCWLFFIQNFFTQQNFHSFHYLQIRNFSVSRFIFFCFVACCWFGKHVIFYIHRFHSLTLVGGNCCIDFVLYLDIFIVAFLPSEFKNELSA